MKIVVCSCLFLILILNRVYSIQFAEKTDYATCSCDLIQGFCESFCCCDSDCSQTQLSQIPIAKCSTNASNAVPQSCRLNYTVAASSGGFTTKTVDNPDWGCLYSISDTSAYFFNVPELLTSLSAVNNAINALRTEESPAVSTTIGTTSFYKKGELLYVSYNSGDTTVNYFNLPTVSSFSSSCQDLSYINFLEDRTSTCERSFGSGPLQLSMFKASTFSNIALFESPSAANGRTNKITTKCLDVDCGSIPEPTADTTANTYKDLVNSVSFIITYSATSGVITNVTASIITTTVPNSPASLTQSFSVKFQSDTVYEGTKYPRSGNPGYLTGKPVVGGDVITIVTNPTTGTTADVIRVPSDSDRWFTIVGGGKCDEISGKRRPVLFGSNTYSSCYLEISSTDTFDCYLKNFEILQILKGTSLPSYLAIWGNSDPERIGEWVPLIVNNPSLVNAGVTGSKDTPCDDVVTGANIEIIYANVGVDSNPQRKVLGARMSFVKGKIQYKCSGLACDPSVLQKVPISTSVMFIDGSGTLQVFEKAKPIYLARLPYDFYYPFLIDEGSSCCPSILTLLVSIFAVVLLLSH